MEAYITDSPHHLQIETDHPFELGLVYGDDIDARIKDAQKLHPMVHDRLSAHVSFYWFVNEVLESNFPITHRTKSKL